MTKNDVYGLVQEGLAGLDEKALQQVLQHLDGIVFGIDKTNEKLDTLDTSLDFIAAALTGEDPVAIATAQGLGRVRPSAPTQTQTQQPQQTNEEQTHTMKLNYEKLARLVKEELEVILTDKEANEMFGLDNMVQEAPQAREPGPIQEDGQIFAPNHYCVHHGAVQNEGVYVAAKAVKHNFNEELGRVTHYDMQLADGTVLENIAAEDILVTEASLAEHHPGHAAKRDEEEDADVNDGTTDDDKDKVKTSYGHAVKEEQEEERLEEYGSGSCRGECNDSGDFHKCMEKCKERKRSEKARSDAKLDKRIGLGQWEEGKVTMSRKGLADMIREEMARLVIIKP